ncbi:FUSC family protein [Actinoplanes sp. NPDC000266]
MDWLRRRDPELLTTRRAVRVTLVACLGFYLCRYVFDLPAMAPYALFGTVALGALSQIPGSPRQRAMTLIAVLPVAWALVSVGTLLSVSNWAAAAGMFVLGFTVSFVGVGGPRLVGLAAGMQLLYILPCFPPYDPGSLPQRLAGVTMAVVLLAAAELLLWPDPTPTPYRERLARAVALLSSCFDALADDWSSSTPPGRSRLAALLPEVTEAAEALRPSRLPPGLRPASASRRDRALSAAAGTARLLVGRTADLYFLEDRQAVTLPASARLLRAAAGCTDTVAEWLYGRGPLPDTDRLAAALADFRRARTETDPSGLPPERLELGALALTLGEWTKSLVLAVRIASGERPATLVPGSFWYAGRSTPYLWWHRLRENLTPRSVAFQGALRLAAALAVARLVAGGLDLSHGFWVLLTILTVLRASAAETRSTLKPALIGTIGGSVVAAGLLLLNVDPTVYVVVLPLVMIAGFASGPLLGLGWSQALFTLVITLVFAQVTPVDWRLAEVRVLDVVIGAVVGVLIGLFAWPRGGAGELRRAAANFMTASASVVRETVAVMARGSQQGTALPAARGASLLAEASFALYQSEHHPDSPVDWQATLLAGHHAVRGAEALVRSCPAGGLLPCETQLTAAAEDVAGCFTRAASSLGRGEALPAVPPPVPVPWPNDLGQDLYVIADLRVWLLGLRDDLTGRHELGDTLRGRATRVADGAA